MISETNMAVNPKSLENLNRKGRITPYKGKKTREVSVSEEGWVGAKTIAQSLGCSGVSEMLEKIGRGEILLS
jgi:hypothetical protein